MFVKYILKATFRYNGKQAQCTTATPDCKIFVPNVYKVITKSASKEGDTALGYFYCEHIKTGKGAGGTFSINWLWKHKHFPLRFLKMSAY